MPYTVLDPSAFAAEGMFREDDFFAALDSHDWEQYRGKMVLIRGCGDLLAPPWAFMALTGRLAGLARAVRYGNEHDNVVVYRQTNGQRT